VQDGVSLVQHCSVSFLLSGIVKSAFVEQAGFPVHVAVHFVMATRCLNIVSRGLSLAIPVWALAVGTPYRLPFDTWVPGMVTS
jgi:hypothetical protein